MNEKIIDNDVLLVGAVEDIKTAVDLLGCLEDEIQDNAPLSAFANNTEGMKLRSEAWSRRADYTHAYVKAIDRVLRDVSKALEKVAEGL